MPGERLCATGKAALILTAVLAIAVSALGREYVVDVANHAADDENSGSADSPLKTIQRAADLVQPGDRVTVMPGRYPEGVILKTAGLKGKRITFISARPREAMLDGSEVITGWKRCASAEECFGNPNCAKIFRTLLPAGATSLSANLYEGQSLLHLSQDPSPDDPFYFDERRIFRRIPVAGYSSTRIIDKSYFTQKDRKYWIGATVLVWTANNSVKPRTITGYDPRTGAITFRKTTDHLNVGKDRYAVMNHPALIRGPGQYAVSLPRSDGRRTAFLWPRDEKSLAGGITVSVRKVGFNLNGKGYVTIDGFRIRRYSGVRKDLRAGMGVLNFSSMPSSGVIIRNNEIYQCKSGAGYWALKVSGCNDSLIEGNYVHHNQMNRGIGATGSRGRPLKNVTIRNNIVRRCGGTGINFYFVHDGKIVGNVVRDNRGNHANGITVYLHSRNILISGNRVFRSNMAVTVQESSDITITNNLLVGQDGQSRILTLYGRGRNITVLNNTVLNSSTNSSISIPRDAVGYVVKNNIADGIAVGRREGVELSHNLYTGLTWNMKPDQIGEAGIIEKDLEKIFVAPDRGDYRLKQGGPAVDAGADVRKLVPVDIDGVKRPQGDRFDIGVFERAVLRRASPKNK